MTSLRSIRRPANATPEDAFLAFPSDGVQCVAGSGQECLGHVPQDDALRESSKVVARSSWVKSNRPSLTTIYGSFGNRFPVCR